jgi:hypothetical protein
MLLYINYFLNSFYKCDKCDQTFQKKSEFKIHLKEHTCDSSDTIETSEEKDLTDGKYSNDVSSDKCFKKDKNKFIIVLSEVCFEVISY